MKLDNIIYDPSTLSSAITEQLNAESTTFKAMYPSDSATSLVNTLGAYGSLMQYALTSALANCYTDSAFSEKGIYQLASTLGNSLHGNVSAQVEVNITKNNFIGQNLTIPKETQFEIAGKKFFNPSAIILPANIETVTEVTLLQGEFLEVNKTSTGVENEKFYFSTDFKCNHNYVEVYVNGDEWNVEESFLPYDKSYVYDPSEMNVCVLKTEPDGRSYIKVGNNQLGNLPISGSNIQIRYVSNEGENGNISETESTGKLITNLVYIDSSGNQNALDVTVNTTTTAFGGFSKQSIDTLRYTSPFVFASGHRAVRRQDYQALLQNKCGYLTSAVWGEYEEADKVGAYDALMMNMVYYTGIKSFQTYPYFILGSISDKSNYAGVLNSVRGFWGSFSFRIQNLALPNYYLLVQDTGAKGYLWINDNEQDPRDSLLPDWKTTVSSGWIARLNEQTPIAAKGTGYKPNETLLVSNTNNEVTVRVVNIDASGGVTDLVIVNYKCTQNWSTSHSNPFNTVYSSTPGSGTGLTINLTFTESPTSTIIYTNDDRGIVPPPVQPNPIINARSDQEPNKYYQSLWEPTLLQPVQIIITYPDEPKGIAGIKFQAADPQFGKFIGTVAMFGTNIDPMPSLDNIRNSEDWEVLINRTYVIDPWNNENDNWTDWFATNTFTGEKDLSGLPVFNKYKHYVIEFYSLSSSTTIGDDLLTFNKMKVIYTDDASLLYYESNGELLMNFPVVGSPGPDTSDTGYLEHDLLNAGNLPMWAYNVQINGVTSANGYRDGNVLSYIFKQDEQEIKFLIEVDNIDNGTFLISVDNSYVLTGPNYINMPNPASLDDTFVYTAELELEGGRIPLGKGGTGYKPNDIVEINGTDGQLRLRVATVDNSGAVLGIVWLNRVTYGNKYDGEFDTTLVIPQSGSTGTGLKLTINSQLGSGKDGVPGSGGTISITSKNNLQVECTFTGNRIETRTINNVDQPIMEQYNHFTTYMEFKQPEITQVDIRIEAELAQTAKVTSGVILQNIRNNVQHLFDITPDYIGKGLKLSDIYSAVMKTEYVNWCRVITPLDNINVDKNGLLILSNLEITEVIKTFK